MECRTLLAAVLLPGLLTSAGVAGAQSMDGHAMNPAAATRSAPAPQLRLQDALSAAPLHRLPDAAAGAVDQLEALRAWNAAGKLPLKHGFARPLTAPAVVRLGGIATAPASPVAFAGGILGNDGAGGLVWGTHVQVANAYRLRLHLTDVHLPAGTSMLVSAGGGWAPHAFGLELLAPDGELWTPTVKSDSLLFEVHVPAGAAASFRVPEVMEIVDLNTVAPSAAGPGDPACIVDSTCIGNGTFSKIAQYRHAMAQLTFADMGGEFLCSGSLLNDTKSDGTPYLLTANHCFADQPAASSLEAVFDFFTATCNGAAPDETTLPTANGGTLLATNATSDFTFVLLSGVPAGRFSLGWNADTIGVPNGTALFRLSFPAPGGIPDPERFSQSAVNTGNSIPVCDQAPDARPRPDYLYASVTNGGTIGGSSGSPALLANGQVVGQLTGGCAFQGHDPSDGCDRANSEFDGAFSITFPNIEQFLSPTVTSGPCVPSATVLCIDNNPGDKRFKVTATFATTQSGGLSGSGNAIQLLGLDGGLMWFFSATNPEMLIKVIDGCPVNSKFWVFFAATTNVGFNLTVTDTVTGHQQFYANADLQAAAPVQDTNALACN
jgi:hypothetical protein